MGCCQYIENVKWTVWRQHRCRQTGGVLLQTILGHVISWRIAQDLVDSDIKLRRSNVVGGPYDLEYCIVEWTNSGLIKKAEHIVLKERRNVYYPSKDLKIKYKELVKKCRS